MNRMIIAILLAIFPSLLQAEDIVGVQPAALDQPRVYVNVRRSATSSALAAKIDDQKQAAIEAFLDTGASAIALSDETYKAMGITKESLATHEVEYEDVGVGGSEKFGVSEPLLFSFAPYSSKTDGENENDYSKPAGPLRIELRPAGGLLESLSGGVDVAGMPAMVGQVVVIDPKPVNTFTDKLETTILPANDPRVPKVSLHIPLTYVAFDRFTRTTPGADGPKTFANPLIGPDPFKPGDSAKSIYVRHGNKTLKMTMLLDTGAACSMISRKQAALLGVTYSSDEKKLVGVPDKEQFSLTVSGIGGEKTAIGFYLDRLALPTKEGEAPIIYGKAPMLVNDISVVDPKTRETFTLDGVLGMNFLVASANVTGGLLPDIGQLTEGPFKMIVIDHARKFLGVEPR